MKIDVVDREIISLEDFTSTPNPSVYVTDKKALVLLPGTYKAIVITVPGRLKT